MKTRIIVAAVGLPLLLVVLLVLPPVATAILVGAMSVIAVYELMYQTGLARNLYLMVLSGVMALAVSLWSCGGCEWTPALVGIWVYLTAMAAVMLASTETTFYTIAGYFGAAGIRKTRYTIPAALCADLAGFIAASWAVRVCF